MDEYDLFDMEVNEISSVTRGDNRGAKILMFKSAGDEEGEPDLSWVDDFVAGEAEATPEPPEGFIKGAISAIGKAIGLTPEQIEKAEETYKPPDYEQIERGRMMGVIREEIALKVSSLFDALMMAVEQDDGGDAMRASAGQFAADMDSSITAWSAGRSSMGKAGRKLAGGRRRRLVEAVERLAAIVNETAPQETRKNREESEVPMKLTMEKAKEMGLDLTEDQLAEINKVHAEADPEEVAKAAGADPDEVEFQKMLKSADPGLRSYLEKQRAEQKADREKVANMQKAQEIGEFTKMAKDAGMSEPEQRAEDLYKLSRVDPEAVKKVVAEAKAANARLKTAGLFDEVAKKNGNGAGGGTAVEKAKAKAAEIRKADPKLTEAQAMSKAWEDDELAEEYEQERAS